jgi:CRISP-associated protein Cas1
MAWKGVHLTKAARPSFADGQCCVKQDDGEVRISIEDLAWVVIDTPQATLTSALMAACMDARRRHRAHRRTPHAVGTRPSIPPPSPVIARLQADAKDSLKKRLW